MNDSRAHLEQQRDKYFFAVVKAGTEEYFSTPESAGRLLWEDYEDLKSKNDKYSRTHAEFLEWLLDKLDGMLEDARRKG